MPSPFMWYELMTSDPDAAAQFYERVIGWSAADSGMPGMDYRLLRSGEASIAGLMALPSGAAEAGMRPAWFGYVAVADVEAAIAGFLAAGGGLLMPATDIPGIGRFALVTDPQGAALYIMAPAGEGESLSYAPGKPGHGGWHELHTTDSAAAVDFYASQFGWAKTGVFDMGPMGAYHLLNFGSGDQAIGMMTDPQFPRPAWLYYINVDDIEAATARATAAGAAILFGPMEVPGGMWALNAADPQGAVFCLVGPKVG